jgi:chromosome segregation ATPase
MTEKIWPDERIKARAAALDGELYDGNTRPWQHYMGVWRTVAYEMRDDYERRIADLEAQITTLLGANQAALARYAAAHTRNGELSTQVADLQAMTRELRRQVATLEDMEPELPEWAVDIKQKMAMWEGD